MADGQNNDKQNVEQRLLEAAEKVFLEKGYAAAKTTDIANEAGVTHAMLHYYFRTKENLFRKVLISKIGMMKELLSPFVMKEGAPVEERISELIDRQFDKLKENPRLPLFVINEFMSRPERVELFSDAMQGIFSDIVVPLQKELDEYSAKGEIEETSAVNLMIDIISLNAFTFMANPFLSKVSAMAGVASDDFEAMRKEETKKVILSRLKKYEK